MGHFFKLWAIGVIKWAGHEDSTEDIIFLTVSVCIYFTKNLYQNTMLTSVYHPGLNFNSTRHY